MYLICLGLAESWCSWTFIIDETIVEIVLLVLFVTLTVRFCPTIIAGKEGVGFVWRVVYLR